MSRDLELARRGALTFIDADLVTDEILDELDAWAEIGFVVLECGCLWTLEDVDAIHDHDCSPREDASAEQTPRVQHENG